MSEVADIERLKYLLGDARRKYADAKQKVSSLRSRVSSCSFKLSDAKGERSRFKKEATHFAGLLKKQGLSDVEIAAIKATVPEVQ